MNEARRPTNHRMAALESAAEKVARTIAQDHNIRVVVGAGASYDWTAKTLSIPAFSQDPEDPILTAAHRGILDHELAHVVETDFPALESAINRWVRDHGNEKASRIQLLANLYEDHWIEPAYGKKYKGAVYHFDKKNEYLVRKTGGHRPCDPTHVPEGSEGPMGVFGALVQAILRTAPNRRNVRLEDVHPEVQKLMTGLETEIGAGYAAQTTVDAIFAAEETWKKLEELAEPPPPSPPQPQQGEGGQGEGSEGEQSDEEQGQGEGTGQPQEGGQDGEGQGQEQSGEPGDSDGQGGSDQGQQGSSGAKPGGDQPAQAGAGSDPSGNGKESGAGAPTDGDVAGDPGAGGAGGVPEADGEADSGTDDGGAIASGGVPETGATEGAEPGEHRIPGAGAGPEAHEFQEGAAQAIGGEWGEVKSDMEVIGNQFIQEVPPQYTVHPQSKASDRLVTYNARKRTLGREKLGELEKAAGPAVKKLQSYLQGAFQASRQSLVIGGMEDGDDLDANAIPGIALGSTDRAIFTTTVRAVEESTFVAILVDCSGSMGDSGTVSRCVVHRTDQATCEHNERVGCRIERRVTDKAGYAAVTAMAIHKALRSLRVAHGVLGYTTDRSNVNYVDNPRQVNGYKRWSRLHRALVMHEFVPAPGISDDGAALPYIDGHNCNLDGESVLWAAKYAAAHGGQYDRVILMVVADGLPAGADDHRIESAYLREVVQQVACAKIEVYGIGVCIHDWTKFSAFYPESKGGPGKAPTGAIEIKSGQGLTDNVLRRLTALLTRGYGMTRKTG